MNKLTRRRFLQVAGIGAGTVAIAATIGNRDAAASEDRFPNGLGLLIDTTICIGCRICEAACNKVNGLPAPKVPFTDRSVLKERRRTHAGAFTVVNAYPDSQSGGKEIYRKTQCMHCLDAACVSACPVGAMHKADNGATIYDDSRCIGCRYCMVACPYDIPTFTWDRGLKDQAVIRKCSLCHDRISQGLPTTCAESCPTKAILFGKRAELLALAKKRIAGSPDRYINHVYGEEEAGGTSILYLVQAPPEQLGLPNLSPLALPVLTETVMSATVPFAGVWGGILAGVYKLAQLRNRRHTTLLEEEEPNGESPS